MEVTSILKIGLALNAVPLGSCLMETVIKAIHHWPILGRKLWINQSFPWMVYHENLKLELMAGHSLAGI
jgi:hypothetical protein